MLGLIGDISNITCSSPDGAFYVFPDFSQYLNQSVNGKKLKDTFDISQYILESANVVTVPGDGFGARGHIRFSYATSSEIIEKGIEKIKVALNKVF